MIILIDGYNLLKSLLGLDFVPEQHIVVFLHQLERYAQQKHHTLVVVFDGDPPPALVSFISTKVLKLVFSGRDSADDHLKEYLDDYKAKDAILITADRQLVDYAYKSGIVSINPHTFYAYVARHEKESTKQLLPVKQGIKKMRPHEHNMELDTLMMEQGGDVPITKEEAPQGRHLRGVKQQKRSKKMQKKEAILKKL